MCEPVASIPWGSWGTLAWLSLMHMGCRLALLAQYLSNVTDGATLVIGELVSGTMGIAFETQLP